MSNQPVKKVVIVGGGTAGWMAAAAISTLIGKTLDISLIESDAIGTVGVGEATIPTMITLHRLLKIDERDFMASVQGTFKLGISFENWKTWMKITFTHLALPARTAGQRGSSIFGSRASSRVLVRFW